MINGSGDPRDYTKEPVTLLDPMWVLKMRNRLKEFKKSGDIRWFESKILADEVEVTRG
jgi:hypothetical protein